MNQCRINTRDLTMFSTLEQELSYDPHKNYLYDLSFLSGIDLIGEKSRDFLQGQVSCDVREVNQHHMQQGAMCNLKGRVLALLDVVDWQGLHLILPDDLRVATRATFAKTAPFSQVTLMPSTRFKVFGFHLQNKNDRLPFEAELPTPRHAVLQNDAFCCYHLGHNLYIFLVETTHSDSLCAPFLQHQYRGSLAWHHKQLQVLQVDIYPESRGLFLPHRLGLQHSGHLSFNKGCYKGQEIIARTHYRAKPKHALKQFTVQTQSKLIIGQKLLSLDKQTEVGELIDYCPIEQDRYLVLNSMIFEHPSNVRFEDDTTVCLVDYIGE